MQIHIAKVNGVLYSGEAESLTAPGEAGEVTILANHVPLVTNLKPGRLTVHKSDGDEVFKIEKGILEVTAEGATVLL